MSDVLRSRPELRSHVTLLEGQHPLIQREVDELAVALNGDAELGTVGRRIGHLLATIGAHEHAELEMLREAMLTDIGITD